MLQRLSGEYTVFVNRCYWKGSPTSDACVDEDMSKPMLSVAGVVTEKAAQNG